MVQGGASAEVAMLKEFREFAMRGNVVDLAIGIVIGVAFGAIVTSLVGDIFMPIIGAVTGGRPRLRSQPKTAQRPDS